MRRSAHIKTTASGMTMKSSRPTGECFSFRPWSLQNASSLVLMLGSEVIRPNVQDRKARVDVDQAVELGDREIRIPANQLGGLDGEHVRAAGTGSNHFSFLELALWNG